jgi:hypothetical protein
MKKFVLLILISVFAVSMKAQEDDGLESILYANIQDANKLTQAYLNPGMKGLIYGMNSGWYHTAQAHKTFGFDFSFGLNASMVPDKDELFRFADLGLSSTTTANFPTSPTVAGTNNTAAQATVTATAEIEGQNVSKEFKMPAGVKEDLPLNAVPTPSVQFTLGLPKQFDVMVRLVPEVGSDDVKGNLYGIGVKKEITSLFGVIEKLPLHISLLGAYTNMDVNYNIQNDSSIPGANQVATFNLSAYTVQAIASINFPIINFYGGIGYGSGTSDLKMLKKQLQIPLTLILKQVVLEPQWEQD